ncbi:hypothetical protein LCGC14_2266350, partial [marine sediment metagenome]
MAAGSSAAPSQFLAGAGFGFGFGFAGNVLAKCA